ncbi:GLPGLI family protein [Aureibaculum marinum]|uniref:GLPGLI family protein n=1 Tax=Aureibaculum marinum TaxID=2487930 RepID=A0A3N4NXX2_9FLAO|nr:GLPGLI family protein [Aureibaculum marinum]RPE00915.1 GLPGLI family protein [Aureibaculum marinum]
MRKQFLLLVVSIAIFNYVRAQNSDVGIIYYNYINNQIDESFNSYLVFNQTSSHYVTAKDSLGLSNSINKKNKNNDEMLIEADEFNDIKKTRKDGFQVFLNKKTDSLYFTNAFSLTSKMIYAKEKTPTINWNLQNETKKIGNFNCKKATATFRGRKYICWYTQEIPLSYGPWKLQGLPGVILEAKTEDEFFIVLFKKITYPVSNIKLPSSKKSLLKKNTKFISFEEYKQKQKERIKRVDNSLKVQAKKFNVQPMPFSEKDNFLEVFGF